MGIFIYAFSYQSVFMICEEKGISREEETSVEKHLRKGPRDMCVNSDAWSKFLCTTDAPKHREIQTLSFSFSKRETSPGAQKEREKREKERLARERERILSHSKRRKITDTAFHLVIRRRTDSTSSSFRRLFRTERKVLRDVILQLRL